MLSSCKMQTHSQIFIDLIFQDFCNKMPLCCSLCSVCIQTHSLKSPWKVTQFPFAISRDTLWLTWDYQISNLSFPNLTSEQQNIPLSFSNLFPHWKGILYLRYRKHLFATIKNTPRTYSILTFGFSPISSQIKLDFPPGLHVERRTDNK